MTLPPAVRKRGPEHASAIRRLAAARDEQSRSDTGANRAEVAAREQWLHWVDEGESQEPWADGEWAPNGRADADQSTTRRTKGHRSA